MERDKRTLDYMIWSQFPGCSEIAVHTHLIIPTNKLLNWNTRIS